MGNDITDYKGNVSERVEKMADIFLQESGDSGEGPDFRRDFNAFWEILKKEIGDDLNPRQIAYLAAYSIIGSVTYSAKCADISTRTIYNWKEDPTFMEYYERAHTAYTEYLEMEAQRRAVMGVPEAVYYKGEKVGEKRNYSDSLLKFLLKGNKPDKYQDSKIEIKGGDNGNIQVNFGIPELNQDIDTSEVQDIEDYEEVEEEDDEPF